MTRKQAATLVPVQAAPALEPTFERGKRTNRRASEAVALTGNKLKRARNQVRRASEAKQGEESRDVVVSSLAIAKSFASSLPAEGVAWGDIVREYQAQIEALPKQQLMALKTAYVFSRKVPLQEREDVLSELTLTLIESGTQDARLAYSIARCDWVDFWKRFKTREHFSLNSVVANSEGDTVEWGELLIGEAEFERKECAELSARSILAKCPVWVREIIEKQLNGERGLGSQLTMVRRWVAANPMVLTDS